MSSPVARVSLAELQEPVRSELERVQRDLRRIIEADFQLIRDVNSHLLQMQGKLFRPTIMLLADQATGSAADHAGTLAAVVELIHLATLVHDDIMDDAERRRSQPTVNARWGNSLSVLLGDVLFAHALNLSTDFEDTNISRNIARTATEVCSGEMIQTQRRFDLQLSREDYFRIIRMKTGSLFACAAQLGAAISGASPDIVRRLQSYGSKIGTAYQIYDDCLDIAGSEVETGKTLGTDLRKGKLTLPVLTLLESASAFDRERCCVLVLEGKLEEVTALLQSSSCAGALNASIETAAELIREAQSELTVLDNNRFVDSLFGLGEALRELLEQLRS